MNGFIGDGFNCTGVFLLFCSISINEFPTNRMCANYRTTSTLSPMISYDGLGTSFALA